jgi:hypothetical protein
MNDRSHHLDDATIDRLVDGELHGEERRELLAALDAQPDGWRRCALAFLEAQTWRSQMKQMVAPVSAATADKAVFESKPLASLRGFSGSWLAIAAGLLIAFGVGRQLGVGERDQFDSPQLAGVDSSATSQINAEEKAATGDAVTLVVNDLQGHPQRVTIPLVEGRQLGAQFSETPHWSSPELERRLDAQGLDFAAQRRYAPMYFEQENRRIPLIVPVDDAVVTPVSRPVY